jgi:hypothetical protein
MAVLLLPVPSLLVLWAVHRINTNIGAPSFELKYPQLALDTARLGEMVQEQLCLPQEYTALGTRLPAGDPNVHLLSVGSPFPLI